MLSIAGLPFGTGTPPQKSFCGPPNAPMSANLALVGFFATLEKCPFSHQELRETIEALSPEPYQEINLKVFDTGVAHGNKQSAPAL